MIKTRILALDVATVLGWAIRAKDSSVIYGTQSFLSKNTEGSGLRYLRFRNWLHEMKTEMQPDIVYYEEVKGFNPRARGRDSHTFHSYESVLTSFCEEHRIDYSGIGVGTIKKFVTGRGNANKQEVIAAIKKLGYSPANDNEADAIACLLTAEDRML